MNQRLFLADPSGFGWLSKLMSPRPQILGGLLGWAVLDSAGVYLTYRTNEFSERMMVKYPILGTIVLAATCDWGDPYGCAAANAGLTQLRAGTSEDLFRARISAGFSARAFGAANSASNGAGNGFGQGLGRALTNAVMGSATSVGIGADWSGCGFASWRCRWYDSLLNVKSI